MRYGRIYRVLEVFTNLVYLNVLWLVACIPVVTIPTATSAMFGVARRWVRGDEPPVAREFIRLFRADLRQSLIVGFAWGVIGAVLAMDFYLIGQMETFRRPLYVALFVLVLLYAFASVYVFPVMVNYDLGWTDVMKNALLFSLAAPFTTLQCLLIVAVAAFVTVSLPVAVLISGGATAYAVYFFCDRSFRRIEALKGTDTRDREAL